MFAEAGERPQTVRNAEKSFQLLLTLALDPRVIVLRVHDRRGNIFLDGMDEMEAGGFQ